MRTLKGTQFGKLPVTGLKWVSDLQYFDGPLVSYFRHERTDDSYIKYWVDCDSDVNRWMWVRVTENDILRLSNKVETLDRVIPHKCQDDFVYFVDTGPKTESIVLIYIKDIPQEYTPDKDAVLSPEGTKNDKTFPILIEEDLEPQDLTDIPRVFRQAYSILYLLSPNHAASREKFLSHPWRGGFSSVHFYNEVEAIIPNRAQFSFQKIQYASPGFMRFSLDRPTAEMVSHCVGLISKKGSEARRAYHSLGSYIHTNKLNKLKRQDASWPSHKTELVRRTKRLLESLEIDRPTEVIAMAPRPFEAAKIARSIFKRLNKLANFQEDGLITLPKD